MDARAFRECQANLKRTQDWMDRTANPRMTGPELHSAPKAAAASIVVEAPAASQVIVGAAPAAAAATATPAPTEAKSDVPAADKKGKKSNRKNRKNKKKGEGKADKPAAGAAAKDAPNDEKPKKKKRKRPAKKDKAPKAKAPQPKTSAKKAKSAKKRKDRKRLALAEYHPMLAGTAVPIMDDGKISISHPEGVYRFAQYVAASTLMLTGTKIDFIKSQSSTLMKKVENDKDMYKLNACASVVDHQDMFDAAMMTLRASDGVGDHSLPKWGPADNANIRLADCGEGFHAGLPIYAWKQSGNATHWENASAVADEDEPALIYCIGKTKSQMEKEPALTNFAEFYRVPPKAIKGRDSFLTYEQGIKEEIKGDPDLKPSQKRREFRNFIYVNGQGRVDHVFDSVLFKDMHTFTGFGRADMLYAPSPAQLPEAYKMAFGRTETSSAEQRKFKQHYLAEDMVRHFEFTDAAGEEAFIKTLREGLAAELKDDPAATHSLSGKFGNFNDFLVLVQFRESQRERHCAKMVIKHRSIDDVVPPAAEIKAAAPDTAAAAAAPAPTSAAASVANPASAADEKGKAPPPVPAPAAETVYSVVKGKPHHYAVWTLQRIPTDWIMVIKKENPNQDFHQRLTARRIATLWKTMMKSPEVAWKTPPNKSAPLIYQEDVRQFIESFGYMRLGWHKLKPRRFTNGFSCLSAYSCTANDGPDCRYGLYIKHLIDDLSMPVSPKIASDAKHELFPLAELLRSGDYQQTGLRIPRLKRKANGPRGEKKEKAAQPRSTPDAKTELEVLNTTMDNIKKEDREWLVKKLEESPTKARTPIRVIRKWVKAADLDADRQTAVLNSVQNARKKIVVRSTKKQATKGKGDGDDDDDDDDDGNGDEEEDVCSSSSSEEDNGEDEDEDEDEDDESSGINGDHLN